MNSKIDVINPGYLVETEWLAAHLADPNIRIFDCTTYLDPDPVNTYSVRSGVDNWAQGHIPGADYLDLQGELSDNSSPLRFTAPSTDQFAAAMSRHGVGMDNHVVLYCTDRIGWATRAWWLLRAFGFDNASVLNGGLDKWVAEGRTLSKEPARYPQARFVARPRPNLFATKAQVAAATDDAGTCIVNALTELQHRGEGGVHYGRPGRIAGSVNVPTRELVDQASNTYLSTTRLAGMFEAVGAVRDRRIIAYCGGGIAASASAFVLTLLGYSDVAVYDGSLSEWSKDPMAPMETGPHPRP